MKAALALCALSVLCWVGPGAAGAREGDAAQEPEAAPPQSESDAPAGPDYARSGFYVSAGGVWGGPMGWDDDVQRGFKKRADEQADESAQENAEAAVMMLPPPRPDLVSVDPVDVRISGLNLNGGAGGFGGSIGYRVAPRAALEIEGEWIDDIDSSFRIDGTTDKGVVKVHDLWTLTANLRIYPLTGRFQPFGIVGLGVQSSSVKVVGASDQLTTTANLEGGGTLDDIPSEFSVDERGSQVDGAIRVGGGLDAYITEHVAAEVKVDYVVPFVDTTYFTTDYLSVRVGVLLRF